MEPTIAQLGEDRAIALIAQTLSDLPLPEGWVGIGDDAAVTTAAPGQRLVTTTDILVEDVHFRRSTTPAADLGWKAIAVNVSDVASMGAVPRWATVSVALPKDCPVEWLQGFYAGVAQMARKVGLSIVGGDTTGSPGPVMVSVTVIGETERPLLRTGAQPGDVVAVTGAVGESAAGLWLLEHGSEALRADPRYAGLIAAHRRPQPHVREGEALAQAGCRVSVLDNSDGLGRSALILAEANGLGVELSADRVPLTEATREVARRAGVSALCWGLWGGEDYHLVLSVEPDGVEALRERLARVGGELNVVGRMTEGPPRAALIIDGQAEPLRPESSYQHFGPPQDPA